MSDRLLVLVRHGQSEWNLKNLFTGWRDVDLTEQGVKEAREAGRKLKAQGLSIVLVEQNPKLVLDLVDDIVILNSGRVAVSGPAEHLKRDGVDLRQHLGVF